MDNTVLTYLDAYCERGGDAGLWGEPLNAITNLCFIVAAVLAGQALSRAPKHGFRLDLWFLVLFLFAIGVGSFAWHLTPTGHTVLMDVIPITLFINLYLISALRRLFNFSWGKTLFFWGSYFALGLLAQYTLPPDLLNGTVMYLPTFGALILLTWGLGKRHAQTAKIFRTVLLVWTASLIFRTVDLTICTSFPLGTHFLWHALNAWVLWRLLMVLITRLSAVRAA